jgi:hypothetical protein
MSFGLFFIPKSFVYEAFSNLTFFESYERKLVAYSDLEAIKSARGRILAIIKSLWFYSAFFYLIFVFRVVNVRLYSFVSFLLISIAFLSSFPVAFYRYIVFAKLIFLLFIFCEMRARKYLPYAFFFLYFLGFFVDIFILRETFFESPIVLGFLPLPLVMAFPYF